MSRITFTLAFKYAANIPLRDAHMICRLVWQEMGVGIACPPEGQVELFERARYMLDAKIRYEAKQN